ncbi:MAG: hypothetical protein R8M38_08110 [Mariprofundaceae bacterium]
MSQDLTLSLPCRFRARYRGFTLVDTAIILIIIGGLMTIAIGIVPQYIQRIALQENKQAIAQADRAILGFATSQARLPCPDSSGDGLENCGATAGSLPWRTLDLPSAEKGAAFTSLRYAAYSNTSNLTTLTNTYIPTVPTGETAPFNQNGLDFCQQLLTADVAAFSANFAYTTDSAGIIRRNVAYALSSVGFANADALGTTFDGLNSGITPSFSSANRTRGSLYDDQVLVRDFKDLSDRLSCQTVINSIGVMSEVYDFAASVLGSAIQMRDDLIFTVVLDTIAVAVAAMNVVSAGIVMGAAISTMAGAASALGGAIASCFVFVGCAFIPIYTAAVIAAGIAIAAVGVAIALNIGVTIAAAVALGMHSAALAQAITLVGTATNNKVGTAGWMGRMDAAGVVR